MAGRRWTSSNWKKLGSVQKAKGAQKVHILSTGDQTDHDSSVGPHTQILSENLGHITHKNIQKYRNREVEGG